MHRHPTTLRLPLWWWLLPLLLLLFWLSAHNLDTNPVWGDERFSIRDAGGLFYGPLTPGEIWQRVALGNPWHTPGFFVILSGWGRLVGWELPALRMLSLLLGLLAVAWTYRLGADRLSPRAGLYGAAILSTSMLYVHYVIKVRMYTQITVLTVFTIWLYLRMIDRKRQPRWWEWVGLFVGAVGLLYTHYFAAIPLIAIGLYHLMFVRKDRRWWFIVGVMLLAGLLFLPWFNVLLDGITHASEYEDLHEMAVSYDYALYRLAYMFGNTHLWLLLASLAAAAIMTLRQRGANRVGIAQMWFFTGVILAVILVVNEVMQIMHEGRLRYMIGVWPPLALIVGFVLAGVGERWRGLALAVLAVWMGTGVVSIASREASRDLDGFDYLFPFHEIADALDGSLRAGDMVINFLPDDDETRRDFHYAGITPFYFGTHLEQTWLRSADLPTQTVTLSQARDRLHVWLAYQPDPPPARLDTFTDLLSDHAYCRTEHESPDVQIDLYTRLPICCLDPARAEPLIAYPDQIALVGFDQLPVRAGRRLPVVTTWAVGADSAFYSYSMALHVLDADGELVAQVDQGLPVPAFVCHQTDIDISGLPPGDYTVHLIVYNWETGIRLPGTLPDETTGDSLPVADFRVG